MTDNATFRREFATWTKLTTSGADVEEYADCYSFNATATFVWLALDGRRSVRDIGNLVADKYSISAETAVRDVRTFLDALLSARLIEPAASALGRGDVPRGRVSRGTPGVS